MHAIVARVNYWEGQVLHNLNNSGFDDRLVPNEDMFNSNRQKNVISELLRGHQYTFSTLQRR